MAVEEGKLEIDEKQNETVNFSEYSEVMLTKKASFAVTDSSETTGDVLYALYSNGNLSHQLITAENSISVTSKEYSVCGIFTNSKLDLDASNAKTWSVSSKMTGNEEEEAGLSAIVIEANSISSDKDFKATLKADIQTTEGNAKACAIQSNNSIMFEDAAFLNSITAKAVTKDGSASAYGISTEYEEENVLQAEKIAKTISTTATGTKDTTATGISCFSIKIDELNGALKSTASSTISTAPKEIEYKEYCCSSCGINCNDLQISTLKGGVTSSATVKCNISSGELFEEDYYCSANVKGLFADSADIDLLSGKISATAKATDSSKEGKLCVKAYAAGLYVFDLTVDECKGSISANASGVDKASASAIFCAIITAGTISGAITAKATASDGSADASGISIYAYGEDKKIDTISGKINVTAKASKGSDEEEVIDSAKAYGIYLEEGNLSISGECKDITANATGVFLAEAFAIQSFYSVEVGKVSGGFTAKATASDGSAKAYGVKTVSDIQIGSFAKKISVTAKASKGSDKEDPDSATAYGLYTEGKIEIDDECKDISAEATGVYNATAYAVNGFNVFSVDTVSGAVSAKATASDGDARAKAISASEFTFGSILKDIKATATAKKEHNGYACGISCDTMNILGNDDDDSFKNITVSATADKGYAFATGVYADLLQCKPGDLNFGTISVKTSSKEYNYDDPSDLYGLNCGEIRLKGSEIAGTSISVTASKRGCAYGLAAEQIVCGKWTDDDIFIEDESRRATIDTNISVSGQDGAVAVYLKKSNTITIAESSISAKLSKENDDLTAYSILAAEDSGDQDIVLSKTIMRGDVELGNGNDLLAVRSGSVIYGDIEMGEGINEIRLGADGYISGDISNAEIVWEITPGISSGFWNTESLDFSDTSLALDITSAPTYSAVGIYSLMFTEKECKTSSLEFELRILGEKVAVLNESNSFLAKIDDFKYEIYSSANNQSMALAISRL